MKKKFSFILVLLTVVFFACENTEKLPLRRQHQLEIKIAFSGDTKEILKEVSLETINNLDLKIPSIVKLSKIDGFFDAERLGAGKIKVDAWLAPSSTLIDVVNKNVSGLGSTILDCENIFSSPIVAAINPNDAEKLNFEAGKINVESFVKAASEEKIWLALPDPLFSAVGIQSLHQLLIKNESSKFLSNFQKLTWSNSTNSVLNLNSAKKQHSRSPIVFTSEQELLSFSDPFYQAHYFNESSWLNYGFCIANSENLSTDKLRILKAIQANLLSNNWQLKAKERGFRTISSLPATQIFDSAKGIISSLPAESLKPPRSEDVIELIETWKKTKRKSATVFLVDTSSSMEGDTFRELSGLVTSLATNFTAKDNGQVSLIRFSNLVDQNTPFATDVSYLSQRLITAKPLGGSALYDALKRAFDLLSSNDAAEYQKRIIFFTDGADSSSRVRAEELKKLISLNSTHEPVILIGILIGEANEIPAELKSLVRDLGGVSLVTTRKNIPALGEDIYSLM
ncbi:MAG: VWA domain-containing protein [Bdellovibrionales bacterium]|nr:VWA domain-containing protein [Bdellovibrionales bacterium]